MSNLMDCSTLGFPILHHLLEFSQTHVYEAVMLSHHFILCRSFLLLLSIFPNIRVYFNGLALHKWPKYWSFSFSTSPSNEYLDESFICLWPEGLVMCGLLSAWWGFGCSLRRDCGRLLRVFLQKEKLLSWEISTNKNILCLTWGTLLSTL